MNKYNQAVFYFKMQNILKTGKIVKIYKNMKYEVCAVVKIRCIMHAKISEFLL